MSVRIPRTKGEIVDRILSIDFSGDLRTLDTDPSKARLRRISGNTFSMEFSNGQTVQFVVRKPRTEAMLEEMRKRKEAGTTKKEELAALTEEVQPVAKRRRGRPPTVRAPGADGDGKSTAGARARAAPRRGRPPAKHH